jgi:tetratricopeptide (TPR) repeat protein
MNNDRILEKLDSFLHRNDYASAEQHLLYWLAEAQSAQNGKTELMVRNELMGLYRKLGKREQALAQVGAALEKIGEMGVGEQVGAATTYLNGATVYKAFGLAEDAIPLFERARAIYERELPPQDGRLGGLYNNMGLALVDLKRFEEADALYRKAIAVMQTAPNGALEVAITYLNMATAAEAELGLWDADEKITDYLKRAEELLNRHQNRDGYYAFVCEKCASVYGYYGYFEFEKELTERARRIYEGA